MHFSIPDTQEFIDSAGNTYIGYNIHINGLFHCTARYKQLYNLHVQLSKDLDMLLPIFPPKKFFPLTATQQEERRLALEKYIQSIGQNIAINNSEILNGFLLSAQQESVNGLSEQEILDIFLMSGSKISLNISPEEHSGKVLKRVYKHIKLAEKYHFHFALFIITQDESSGSIKTAVEIRSSWIPITKEVQHQLENLQKSESKKEYLNVVRLLKYYGYIQFAPCYCDYPERSSKVLLAIGENELNLRVLSSEEHEIAFKVSRMRCWRITTIQNGTEHYKDNNECNLELSFEYLIARNELQWITIVSEQAILMSVCLQAMIDELLQKCVVGSKTQTESGKSWTYIMRDGQSRTITGSPLQECVNNNHSKSGPIIKKLANKWSAVTSKKSDDSRSVIDKTQTTDLDVMENNVFHMIGDDDL
ncbi:PREDICTED: sorting nexin-17 isoform X2 [Acromyrmex echinatior]|uniref:sorting nexin-17 isoform X2 n=1 Tax=Acromyrmex echinatior TaxID=103372 RepID=UPI000580B5D2|nr:PREDICTED: sorting nexin-17 isoform X2 [Acromyrmex echinatior]